MIIQLTVIQRFVETCSGWLNRMAYIESIYFIKKQDIIPLQILCSIHLTNHGILLLRFKTPGSPKRDLTLGFTVLQPHQRLILDTLQRTQLDALHIWKKCMYVCMYGWMHACMHVCMYVSMWVCVYVCCMYIQLHIQHTHINIIYSNIVANQIINHSQNHYFLWVLFLPFPNGRYMAYIGFPNIYVCIAPHLWYFPQLYSIPISLPEILLDPIKHQKIT